MAAEIPAPSQDWFEAAKAGNREVIARYLSEGMAVDARDDRNLPWDQTALMYAAYNGHVELVRFLLQSGASVRAQDRHAKESEGGHRPLHHAAAGGTVQVIGALLDAGADPNALTTSGNPPLNLAIHHNQPKAARFLLAHGASPALSGGRKRPVAPLYAAANAELNADALAAFIPLLLDAGADPNGRGAREMTVLHRLAFRHDLPRVELGALLEALLTAGADPDLTDDGGGTALQAAVLYRIPDAVRVLTAAGADLHRQYQRGTVLQIVQQDLDYFRTRLEDPTLPEPVREVVRSQYQDAQQVHEILSTVLSGSP